MRMLQKIRAWLASWRRKAREDDHVQSDAPPLGDSTARQEQDQTQAQCVPLGQATETPAPRRDARIRERLQYRGIAKVRREIADTINDVLDRLAALDLKGGDHIGAKFEAQVFNEIMGCDFMLMHEIIDHEALVAGGRYTILAPKEDDAAEYAEVCWPVDQAVAVRKDDGYYLTRFRSVTPREVRGRAQFFPAKMIRQCAIKMFDDGRWYGVDEVSGLINGRWRPLDTGMRSEIQRGGNIIDVRTIDSTSRREEIHRTVSGLLSLALSRRYSWHVALGATADGPRILLPTNPRGCLQFFKDRERDHRSRRAALRHWVTRHYRETDKSGLSYVREHLRGNTEFRWTDLACEIFVSAFDLEKNEEFRMEAEQWRAQRKHNRVRVRLKRHREETHA